MQVLESVASGGERVLKRQPRPGAWLAEHWPSFSVAGWPSFPAGTVPQLGTRRALLAASGVNGSGSDLALPHSSANGSNWEGRFWEPLNWADGGGGGERNYLVSARLAYLGHSSSGLELGALRRLHDFLLVFLGGRVCSLGRMYLRCLEMASWTRGATQLQRGFGKRAREACPS